ncbi:MAG: sigma-70 family RNA polymerase sigma factor [Clostridiales bacterium]|nr:sigma-70 family RNA polymerase sigma factor [Clostridiales bacterium]
MNDENYNENELVNKARKGDGDAFGQLMHRYNSFIYNVVIGLVKNQYDAQDITQESFFKAYRSLGSFRGDSKFSSWLYRIAVNTAKDFIRSASRRRTLPLEPESDDDDLPPMQIKDDSPMSEPQEVLEAEERKNAVRKAISRLSDNHREIIIMRDIEGYSYEEIGEILNLELGTVKSRINRARNAVKEELIKMKII